MDITFEQKTYCILLGFYESLRIKLDSKTEHKTHLRRAFI